MCEGERGGGGEEVVGSVVRGERARCFRVVERRGGWGGGGVS